MRAVFPLLAWFESLVFGVEEGGRFCEYGPGRARGQMSGEWARPVALMAIRVAARLPVRLGSWSRLRIDASVCVCVEVW